MLPPINFKNWVDENRHLLKPPVGNKCVYTEAGDFIVMVVGGPNSRKDYHYNESEELFYQVEGDIVIKIIENGVPKSIPVREGEMFLLPAKTPHSPQRGPNTIGVVIEKVRDESDTDGLVWFCDACGNKLYDEYFHLENIVTQLPPVMKRFYDSDEAKTCGACGEVMTPPTAAK